MRARDAAARRDVYRGRLDEPPPAGTLLLSAVREGRHARALDGQVFTAQQPTRRALPGDALLALVPGEGELPAAAAAASRLPCRSPTISEMTVTR